MPISAKIQKSIEESSWIRRMFEAGIALKREFGEDNVFDFSLGNPDLEPPAEFFSVLRELALDMLQGAHGYMPNAGFPDVRDSVAKKVSSVHGTDVTGDNVLMTCGAAGGMNVVLKTILNPGDEVIVPRPYFVEYRFYIDNHGGRIVPADTNDDFSLNIQNIRKAVTDKTKAVLINSPNNPTARVYTEDEISALANMLREIRGGALYLISDEPYRDIVYDGRVVPGILGFYDNSIVVTSYSKNLSIPGERIGYIAFNPACADAGDLLSGLILCNRILGYVNAPALMQRVIARLNNVSININVYKKRRDVLADGMKYAGYSFAEPQGAFYLFCRSPIDDDVRFVTHLQKFNVLVVPGSGFGAPGYFRIAYCVSEGIINRAIPRFKEAIEAL